MPTLDALAQPDGLGGFNVIDGATSINVQQFAGAVDRRGIVEFSLAGLPANAVVQSASIDYHVSSLTFGDKDGPMVRLFGYAGNGTLDSADATHTGSPIGTGTMIFATGPTTVPLDNAFVQSLVGTSGYLGVTMLGSTNGRQFGFDTIEAAAFSTPPQLNIVYTVPEPASLALLLLGCCCARVLGHRTRTPCPHRE